MDTIWKFPLAPIDQQKISMPGEFSILHVGKDPGGFLCLWAAVKKNAPVRDVEIIIAGTGQPLPHVGSFLGTVLMGAFVWHIFTGPGDASNAKPDFHYSTKGNGNG